MLCSTRDRQSLAALVGKGRNEQGSYEEGGLTGSPAEVICVFTGMWWEYSNAIIIKGGSFLLGIHFKHLCCSNVAPRIWPNLMQRERW